MAHVSGIGSMAALAAALIACGSSAQPAAIQLEPVSKFEIVGSFAGKKAGKKVTDLSGIACMAHQTSTIRTCLAVNDENQSAQFVAIKMDEHKMVIGPTVRLIGNGPSANVVGDKPSVRCPNGEAGFEEFDGEAVAYEEPYFYVIGSHGCSRKKGEFRPSSFLLARIRIDKERSPFDLNGNPSPSGAPGSVETTFRVADVLQQATQISAYFGKDLNADNGLNIEGMAVMDGKLVLGLRAPSVGGKAFVLRVDPASLFASQAGLVSEPELIALAVGQDAGIRDLAALPDGRLLVLSGPAQEQRNIPYDLFILEPRTGEMIKVGSIKNEGEGKAEAVTVLEANKDELRLLVLFDGLENGDPREYRVLAKRNGAR